MPIKSLINEQELLFKIASGDQQAFAQLFYGYHTHLGEYIYLLTGSKEDAREVVQDVFLKVWEVRETLLTINQFSSWIFILTRNRVFDLLRKSRREQQSLEGYRQSITMIPDITDAFILDPTDYNPLIERAVELLPDRQKMVFELKRQGKKPAEIAAELGIAQDSVRKYQQWALRSIRKFLTANAELSAILLIISKIHER